LSSARPIDDDAESYWRIPGLSPKDGLSEDLPDLFALFLLSNERRERHIPDERLQQQMAAIHVDVDPECREHVVSNLVRAP